jgi:hypothetical protein
MKSPEKFLPVLFALALALVTAGCNHTISESKKTSVSSDGTVRSKETTVTEKSDGTVVKKEETKKTTVRP